jgi:hypothetical protein
MRFLPAFKKPEKVRKNGAFPDEGQMKTEKRPIEASKKTSSVTIFMDGLKTVDLEFPLF